MIRRIRSRRAAGRPAPVSEPDLREPVDGVFEVLSADPRGGVLLGLADDLEYPVRLTARYALPHGGFLTGLLLPDDRDRAGWILADMTSAFPGYQAAGVAQLAFRLLEEHPEDAFRNPRLVERGWARQQEDRDRFVEHFGTDTLILPPAEAAARLNAFREGRWPVLDARTVGVIYDHNDGLLIIPELARVRSMFSYPALASDPDHARTLRWFLDEESITPVPLRRVAAEHPETADEVFRSVLGRPEFCWAAHGEVLLREYKPGYFARDARPSVLVVGDRLSQLL